MTDVRFDLSGDVLEAVYISHYPTQEQVDTMAEYAVRRYYGLVPWFRSGWAPCIDTTEGARRAIVAVWMQERP